MKPMSLDDLFTKKVFRIPDYQRGYAWQAEQLRQFWDDLVYLADGRSHYTGLITLREIPRRCFDERTKVHFLITAHAHRVYHVVDGQQRLTTVIVLLQVLVELLRALPDNRGKPDHDIYVTEFLTVDDVVKKYIYRTPPNKEFKTYKFGYDTDHPSNRFFRHGIIGEEGGGALHETFYTLNLAAAKEYLRRHLEGLYESAGMAGLEEVYKKVTGRLLFNEYVIDDDFDVYVAFETMNSRGKPLSTLELLKNRLIYLVTLYSDEQLSAAGRDELRNKINSAWKEVYECLGRNKNKPLNDDNFLRAHRIVYFGPSKVNYHQLLLDEHFSPRRILQTDDQPNRAGSSHSSRGFLPPKDVENYVNHLRDSAPHWFDLHFPRKAHNPLSGDEVDALLKLHRVGMRYFRPLLLTILKNTHELGRDDAERQLGRDQRMKAFEAIERFSFLVFHTTGVRSNYGGSEFSRAAHEFERKTNKREAADLLAALDRVDRRLSDKMAWVIEDGSPARWFQAVIKRRFAGGRNGYYGWSGLSYFLFEYESYRRGLGAQKVFWEDFKKHERDRVSIEHIAPQSPKDCWREAFEAHPAFRGLDAPGDEEVFARRYHRCVHSLGNLLLLSAKINSALQNHCFERKRKAVFGPNREQQRVGYSIGSHSEQEVAAFDQWGPAEIRDRGMRMLNFFENRWQVKFREDEKERLLMLDFESNLSQNSRLVDGSG